MTSPTQDQWPGPPQTMPQPLLKAERLDRYVTASNHYATLAEITVVLCDLQDRRAKMLYSPPPLTHDEVTE
jgi:hypothetical protein